MCFATLTENLPDFRQPISMPRDGLRHYLAVSTMIRIQHCNKRGRNQMPHILSRPYQCSQSRNGEFHSREYVVVNCFACFVSAALPLLFWFSRSLTQCQCTRFVYLVFLLLQRKIRHRLRSSNCFVSDL